MRARVARSPGLVGNCPVRLRIEREVMDPFFVPQWPRRTREAGSIPKKALTHRVKDESAGALRSVAPKFRPTPRQDLALRPVDRPRLLRRGPTCGPQRATAARAANARH